MMRSRPIRCGALVLALALLPGCAQGDRRPGGPPSGLPALGPDDGARLNAAQTADVEVAMAQSLEKSGVADQATAAYQAALKRDPSRADACARLAVLYDREGRFAEG